MEGARFFEYRIGWRHYVFLYRLLPQAKVQIAHIEYSYQIGFGTVPHGRNWWETGGYLATVPALTLLKCDAVLRQAAGDAEFRFDDMQVHKFCTSADNWRAVPDEKEDDDYDLYGYSSGYDLFEIPEEYALQWYGADYLIMKREEERSRAAYAMDRYMQYYYTTDLDGISICRLTKDTGFPFWSRLHLFYGSDVDDYDMPILTTAWDAMLRDLSVFMRGLLAT